MEMDGELAVGLIRCPDCEKMFSDRIAACPQCGCPIEAVFEEQKKQADIDQAQAETAISQPSQMPREEFVSIPERVCTPKEKREIAYGETLTQMLWMKGFISLEEKRLIDKKLADKIVEDN